MGYSTVAVLHNDMHGDIARQMPRLGQAMLDVNGAQQNADFGVGRIVSWDHASGYQVVVIHGNTGWRVGIDERPPPDEVLQACANALRAHGWRVEKPKNER